MKHMNWNTAQIKKVLGGIPYPTEDNKGVNIPTHWLMDKEVAGLNFKQLLFIADSICHGDHLLREIPRTTLWRWKKDFNKLGLLNA